MRKFSRIVGLAAMLIATVLVGCAPVTDSSEWKTPIGSTTIKPEELNNTPLKDSALKELIAGGGSSRLAQPPRAILSPTTVRAGW